MRIGALLLVVGLLGCTAPGIAEEVNLNSAEAQLAGCVAFAETDSAPSASFFDTGVCAGQMHALMTLGIGLPQDLRFCPPPGSTNGQAARVVVHFMNAHPADLDRNFYLVAVAALRQAFPCG